MVAMGRPRGGQGMPRGAQDDLGAVVGSCLGSHFFGRLVEPEQLEGMGARNHKGEFNGEAGSISRADISCNSATRR